MIALGAVFIIGGMFGMALMLALVLAHDYDRNNEEG